MGIASSWVALGKLPMIRSLHCIYSYDQHEGGAVSAGLNVAKYIRAAGVPAETVASYGSGDAVDYLAADYAGLECHRVARSFPRRYFAAQSLENWLVQNLHRFDLVELHGVFVLTTWRAALVCRRLGKPYLVRSHGALDPFDLQKHAGLKRLLAPFYMRPLLQHSAGVMCTTRMEAERLVTFGANPRRIVSPLPVPDMAALSSEARQRFRQCHGIPQDSFVVLFLSRVDYKKGLQFLIPALAALKPEMPQLWFVMAGSGKPAWMRVVEEMLGAYHMGAWTTRTGFIIGTEKQSALAAADLFALPSLNENFGIAVVEALQAGLPLLLSNQVYTYKEVVEGGGGEVCQPSVSSCTAALRTLLMGKEHLKAMGLRSVEIARTVFSPEAATRKTLEIYQSVVRPEGHG